MKKKSKADPSLVVALNRIVIFDDSGPVADTVKHGFAYQYVAAEKGDLARVLSVSGDSLLCAFHRTKLAVEVPAASVAPYEA